MEFVRICGCQHAFRSWLDRVTQSIITSRILFLNRLVVESDLLFCDGLQTAKCTWKAPLRIDRILDNGLLFVTTLHMLNNEHLLTVTFRISIQMVSRLVIFLQFFVLLGRIVTAQERPARFEVATRLTGWGQIAHFFYIERWNVYDVYVVCGWVGVTVFWLISSFQVWNGLRVYVNILLICQKSVYLV